MVKCKVCGKDIVEKHYAHLQLCSYACFLKDYWLEILREKEMHVVIDGTCYYLDRNNLHGSQFGFKGFDGRLFRIQMLDTGEIIETTNLWYNDVVPEEFRDQLPDNAKFVPVVESKEGDVF